MSYCFFFFIIRAALFFSDDNESIGPFPLMLILSTDGVLVPFYMVYRHKAAVPLTCNVETLSTAGIRQSLREYTSD